MEIDYHKATETFLQNEFNWLKEIINVRMESYFKVKEKQESIYDIMPPIIGDDSAYERFLLHYDLGFAERVIISLITASVLKPELFDLFHTQNKITGLPYTEFGGRIQDRRFVPTFRTAAFMLNESNTALPVALSPLFEQTHPFTYFSLLDFSDTTFQTRMETPIKFSPEAENLLFGGMQYEPDFKTEFPVQLISTDLGLEDLVLPKDVERDVDEMLHWFKLEKQLKNHGHLKKWIKPGFRALFYGPSGTGKKLTTSILGKNVNRPVYRIDLSMVMSKYIGETEKNLARVFKRAEKNGWILFFDEADALFGKRTEITSSNDRHTNQEMAYLLQRIEEFPGMIILASNLESNLDEAFTRRFQLMVPFRLPDKEERLKLWDKIFPEEFGLDSNFKKQAAEKYDLSGGSIVNILRTALLHSDTGSSIKIKEDAVKYAIKQELEKVGEKEEKNTL